MPLVGAGCKGCWGEPVEARVWAFGVVVDPPCFDDPASLRQARKQVFVETFGFRQQAHQTYDNTLITRVFPVFS